MNGYAVLKGASYTLAVTPDMVIHNGTTQTTEMTPLQSKRSRGVMSVAGSLWAICQKLVFIQIPNVVVTARGKRKIRLVQNSKRCFLI